MKNYTPDLIEKNNYIRIVYVVIIFGFFMRVDESILFWCIWNHSYVIFHDPARYYLQLDDPMKVTVSTVILVPTRILLYAFIIIYDNTRGWMSNRNRFPPSKYLTL